MFLLLFPDKTSSLATSSVILLDKVAQKLDKVAIISSNKVIIACAIAINRHSKALKEFLFIS
jgi:menaquinone-dependent protoporphyrinogen IX oxidase